MGDEDMSEPPQGAVLLQPISADQPCGEDLEDTPLLASFDTFRVFGESVPFDPAPEWRKIRDTALEALGQSKDLRLLTYFGSAVLRTEGLPAFFETLTAASQWLDSYWNEVYPRVEEDAVLRLNSLNCFADQMAVVDGLRRAPLVSSRQHGSFSLRDCEIAAGHLSPQEDESPPDENQIDAAFADKLADVRLLSQGVTEASAVLQQIETKMREEAGTEANPSFDPLSAQLVRMDRVLRAQLAKFPDPDAAEDEAAEGEDALGRPIAVGAVKSREDAIRALDAVSEYFRRNEPSSPIPLFLERAKRLVSKDFLEVLADVVPDAVSQAKSVGGVVES
tara:strand:- start:155 stop:1159 length:1005 start_codon:yes stop_codon:yes gene_type:complete